jgi:hypothetical protein
MVYFISLFSMMFMIVIPSKIVDGRRLSIVGLTLLFHLGDEVGEELNPARCTNGIKLISIGLRLLSCLYPPAAMFIQHDHDVINGGVITTGIQPNNWSRFTTLMLCRELVYDSCTFRTPITRYFTTMVGTNHRFISIVAFIIVAALTRIRLPLLPRGYDAIIVPVLATMDDATVFGVDVFHHDFTPYVGSESTTMEPHSQH